MTSAVSEDPLALDRVARLHYEHGLTHQEIAELFGVSRIKVTRRLAEARRTGVVEITVHGESRLFLELETRLQRRFGLRQAWVAPRSTGAGRSLESLARVGAQCVASLVPRCRTVAVGTSATLAATLDALAGEPVTELDVLPVAGSWGGRSTARNPHELALRLANAFAGRAYHLPVPFLAGTPALAEELLADPAVRRTLDLAARADLLLVGVGGTDDTSGLLVGSVSRDQLADVVRAGAVGDISGRFFDTEGRPVPGELDDRVVGLDLARLLAIPTRVAVAAGEAKLAALAAALRAGLINVLVTDNATATALLDQ